MKAISAFPSTLALASLMTALPSAAQGPASSVKAGDPLARARGVVTDLDRVVAPTGVQDTFIATLGGTKQVVNVRGSDRSNPILIFIHGGPGAVEMPMAWSFQRPWEDYFTVVQYD